MIDRQHLVILREVHRLGSVTAAAEHLNLTQSALSHTIHKFEDRHGIKVWIKQGRGLRLTQAGMALLDLARRVLPQLEHAEQTLRDFSTGRRGLLRIGMECHPCQKWLMRVITPYLSTWPDVEVEVCTAFRFDGIAALRDHDIDLLITPDPVLQPDLSFTPVLAYQLMAVMAQTHPLAHHDHLQPTDLATEELITVPVSQERLDIYTRFLIPSHCRPRKHKTAETTELILHLVAAGRGIGVLPDWLIADHASTLPIKALPLGTDGLHKDICIGVRRNDADLAYVRGFMDTARDAC